LDHSSQTDWGDPPRPIGAILQERVPGFERAAGSRQKKASVERAIRELRRKTQRRPSVPQKRLIRGFSHTIALPGVDRLVALVGDLIG
jgi:hypothetical protein